MLDGWEGQYAEAAGADTSTSLGTSITASGSTNTKGSWTQLIASTAHDAIGMMIYMRGNTGTQQVLVDIGIGASSSEIALIPNLKYTNAAYGFSFTAWFPVQIPAGTRLSARCQSSVASGNMKVHVVLIYGALKNPVPLTHVLDYGADTSTSAVTSVDPGGTANTKGAWTQITASTTHDIKALGIAWYSSTAATTAVARLIDIGVGAGGSEQILLPDLRNQSDNSGTLARQATPPFLGCFPVHIPAGTRIAARCACTSNSSTPRTMGMVLYGVS